MAPKKSFPRNGNPGRFAKTIIRKSGCATMTDGEADQYDAATATQTHADNKYNKLKHITSVSHMQSISTHTP